MFNIYFCLASSAAIWGSLKAYNVRNCRKFCGSSKKKNASRILRARTDKFSDVAIRRDNVSRRRLGRALGFLETPIYE
jgi:hypothetical protein